LIVVAENSRRFKGQVGRAGIQVAAWRSLWLQMEGIEGMRSMGEILPEVTFTKSHLHSLCRRSFHEVRALPLS
jgi:hypothetical protein